MSFLSRLPAVTDWNRGNEANKRKRVAELTIPGFSKDLKGDLAIKLVKHDWAKYKDIVSEIAKHFVMPQDTENAKLLAKKVFEQKGAYLDILRVAKQGILMYRHGRIETLTDEMKDQLELDRRAFLKETDLELSDFNSKIEFGILDDEDDDISLPANPMDAPLSGGCRPMVPEYILNLSADELFARAAELADAPYYPPLTPLEVCLLALSDILQTETVNYHVLMIPAHIVPVQQDNTWFHKELNELVKNATRYYVKTDSDEHGHYLVMEGDRLGAEQALSFKRSNTGRRLQAYPLMFSFFPSKRLAEQQATREGESKKKKRDGEFGDEELDGNRVGKDTEGFLKLHKSVTSSNESIKENGGKQVGVSQTGIKRAREKSEGDKHEKKAKGKIAVKAASKPKVDSKKKTASKKTKMTESDEKVGSL